MIGMPVGPVGKRDHRRTNFTNETRRRTPVLGIRPDRAIRPPQVCPPYRAQYGARLLGLGKTLLDSAVASHLSSRQIAQTYPTPECGVLRDGPAGANLEIVRMRTEHEQLDSVHNLDRRWYCARPESKMDGTREEAHMTSARLFVVALAVAAPLSNAACRDREVPEPPKRTSESPATAPPTKRVVGPLTEPEAQALATMNDRLKAYLDIHKDLEKGLPKLSENATPKEIDTNQRMFEQKMRDARKNAKRGEIFTPEAEPVIRRLLANAFSGNEGRELMKSIMDEYPAGVKITVNGRYPDTVPVSTVPPEILQTLPELTEDLEYRFIGRHMILLDTHAHVIADYIENALPPL